MKKFISLLLIICCVFSVCACSSASDSDIPDGAKTVIDGSGAEVVIPENNDELTIASVYAVSVPFLKALQLTDRVVAINVKSNFWTSVDEYLDAAGSVGRGKVDLEALAKYAPDVLVHRSNDPDTLEAVGELGVQLLCISAEDMESIYYTLEMMGEYFGKEERADEVIQWMDAKFAYIDSIVAQIPEDERVTALCMGGELGRIAGGDMLQSWMIEKAGGICVANDVENNSNWITIGVEAIFDMNPDYIFCTSSTALDYKVDEILTDPTWSDISAVKNNHVSVIPAKIDSWDLPGVEAELGTMWMLHQMYPEYFTLEQLEAEIEDYYMFMFGETFDPEYLGYTLE